MDLSSLAEARLACAPRPCWSVLFAKAFALTARSRPELRRSYMSFPWPNLYEHPTSTVCLNVERELPDEMVVAQCLIRRPDNRPLAELDAIVRHYQNEPIEQLRWYRRAVAMSKLPWPIRPALWWATLNVSGRRRCHNFGTFGLSSVASLGAGLLTLVPLLTTSLHHGLFDANGGLEMRMTFDHRVMDGAVAARTLVELERTLQTEILAELGGMRLRVAA